MTKDINELKDFNITLYQALILIGEDGVDICDTDWDWGTYVGIPDTTDKADYYDKFILLFITSVKCLRIRRNGYSPCCVASFIVEHQSVFKDFFNEENREGYRPCDYENADDCNSDKGFYETYLLPLESLLTGNYSEDDYKKLYNALVETEEK